MAEDDRSLTTAAGWLDSLVDPPRTRTPGSTVDDDDTEPGPAQPPSDQIDLLRRAERYTDLGLLARGGMGEVRRVHDTLLGRPAVMKIIHHRLKARRRARARFLNEVRITARLQHPGIVPVQEAGELPDGRLWFTMKEVAGRTLQAIADELHRAMWYGAHETADGWTLRRLIDVLWRISQTLAYAHQEGIIHRDVKPENLMVGAFGEAMVMDWGIAYDLARPAPVDAMPEHATGSDGTGVVGTPSYMAPEQALGQPPTPATDVYALGGVLYHLLAGRKPLETDGDPKAVVQRRPPPVAEAAPPHLPPPEPLADLCDRALLFDPTRRPRDAGQFGEALRRWLDGEARREQARGLVERARQMMPRSAALRARAETLDAEATTRLARVPTHAPVEQKRPGWRLATEADAMRREARQVGLAVAQTLRQALEADPDSTEARTLLSAHYRTRVLDAERRGDAEAAADAAEMLRLHDEPGNAEWLRGDGALTLVTDPPGAEATLYRFVEQDRRLTPERIESLPPTPFRDRRLPMGSYLITLRAPGRADVLYPVHITRGHHWDGVPPEGDAPRPIPLPKADALGPDEVYVPPGWCEVGGDDEATDPLPAQRVWVDGFVMQRHPVTHAAFIEFLDALVADGREDEALRCAPEGSGGKTLYGRGADGRFRLEPHLDIDWRPDMPVMRIAWRSAVAYAEWYGARTGQPWRLPEEIEWEKAARGVDRRVFPMGAYLDPTWACILTSHTARPQPAPIGAFGGDRSPYGIAGLAGNAQDFCRTPYRKFGGLVTESTDEAPTDARFRIVRGGWFISREHAARSADRYAVRTDASSPTVSVRLVRSLDEP